MMRKKRRMKMMKTLRILTSSTVSVDNHITRGQLEVTVNMLYNSWTF